MVTVPTSSTLHRHRRFVLVIAYKSNFLKQAEHIRSRFILTYPTPVIPFADGLRYPGFMTPCTSIAMGEPSSSGLNIPNPPPKAHLASSPGTSSNPSNARMSITSAKNISLEADTQSISTPPLQSSSSSSLPQTRRLTFTRNTSYPLGSNPALMSPLYLDSLTKSTLPTSTVSEYTARFPDWARNTVDSAPIASGSSSPPTSPSSPSGSGGGGGWMGALTKPSHRSRSASIGSLKTIVRHASSSGTSFNTSTNKRSVTSPTGSRATSRSFSSFSKSDDASSEIISAINGGRLANKSSKSVDRLDEGSSSLSISSLEEPTTSEETTNNSDKVSLEQLSWGKWWPFKVVEPASTSDDSDAVKGKLRNSLANVAERSTLSQNGTVPTPTSEDQSLSNDSHAPTRSFLELFAGRGTVQDAKTAAEVHKAEDEAEDTLLEAELDTLRIASTSQNHDRQVESPKLAAVDERQNQRQAVTADTFPLDDVFDIDSRKTPSSSPNRPSRFLPTSLFSSRPMNASTALEGPGALFSSLLISNPFSTLSTSSSKAGPIPTPHSKLAPDPSTLHHRQYSSEPGGTKRSQIDPFLDDEDQETAKEEDDSHMDVFTLIKERYRCPKYPLVFCHGLFGFDTIGPASIKPLQFSYWVGVKEALEAIGVEVLIGRVPASASIEERAKVLCELIETTFPGREVNLIGHSMGGLDGRFLISHLKPTTFKVKSLTTIATPHRGSTFADYLLEDIIGQKRIPSLLSLLDTIGVPGGGKAFDDLTTTKMARFNAETPDSKDVKYFSYGAEFEPGWSNVFRLSWGILHEREGKNDGLVSVESSKWGEYKATLKNVNHLDLVGWVGKVRFGWAEWLGKPIKFKPVSFYCAMTEMLADEGL